MRNSIYTSLNNFITIVVTFLIFGIYVTLNVKPELIYNQQQPLFLLDSDFAYTQIFSYGGFVQYISLLLSQFFISNIAGFIILSAFALFITLLFYNNIKQIFGIKTYTLFLAIPTIILVNLHSSYSVTLVPDLIVIFSLLCNYLFIRILNKNIFFKLLIFFLLNAILFFSAGGVSLLLFGVLSIISESIKMYSKKFSRNLSGKSYKERFSHRQEALSEEYTKLINRKSSEKNKKNKGSQLKLSKLPVLLILMAIITIIPLTGVYIFKINILQSYLHILIPEVYYKPSISLYCLFAIFPLLMLVLNRYCRDNFFFDGKSSFFIQNIIAVGLFVLIITKSYKIEDKDAALIEFYSAKEDWNKVLEVAKKYGTGHLFTNVRTNQALYHKGLLLSDIFTYPQPRGTSGLLPEKIVPRVTAMITSDIYFDLGVVNISKRRASEAFSFYPNSPRVLQRLATVNLITGKDIEAQKFLLKLQKSMIYKDWANKYLQYVNNQELKMADSLFSAYYKKMPKGDSITVSQTLSLTLKEIVTKCPENKMALEYFMSNSLLNKQLIDIFDFKDKFSEMGYKAIPPLYQQALILYYYKIGKKANEILEMKDIDKVQLDDFHGFNKVIAKFHNKPELAKNELSLYYKNTYLYYLTFNNEIGK